MNSYERIYNLLLEKRSGVSRAKTAGRKETAKIEKKKRRAERKGKSTIGAEEAHRMGRRSAESFGASRELTKAAEEHERKGTAASEVVKRGLISHAKERDIVAKRQKAAGRSASRHTYR